MARTLHDLSKRMREHADAVETAASRLAAIGAEEAIRVLVYITPVDTSEHLSNWQLFLDNPAPDAIGPYFLGSRGSTQAASAEEAIDQALTELRFKKPGQPLFISNLGPAIVALDGGSSGQFAGGFVPRAVLAFRVALRDAVQRGAVFDTKVA